MELELNRIDYCTVGVTLPNTMKLFPSVTTSSTGGYKEPQRIVVGDQNGVLQLFSIKKNDYHIHFKTLPMEKITSVQLGGGGSGGGTMTDKIFAASENKVRGYNRKGKIFLAFDTNLTEPIKSMYISGIDLLTCGNHVYNHYKDCKDIGSYLCGDTIIDVSGICPKNTNRIITALACSGRVLRILEHCRVRQSIELESVPTVLYVPSPSSTNSDSTTTTTTTTIGDKLLCGFADGKVIQFRIGQFGGDVKEEILVSNRDNQSAVTCLHTFDLTDDGKTELIVGRRDGTVQVFSLPMENNVMDTEIRQLYNENFHESISSVQGGCVSRAGYTEIVVCTFSGLIFGLTTQCLKISLSDNLVKSPSQQQFGFGNGTKVNDNMKSKITKIKSEIHELEMKVAKERERYQLSTQAHSTGISAIPMLAVNDSMHLCKETGYYDLSIEIPASIEFILLQCDALVHLLDCEENTAIINKLNCIATGNGSTSQLLATYRCQQLHTNRVDIKLKTIEGQHGQLQAFITPNIQPKVSQLRTYPIHPLSLHIRIHTFDSTRPCNTLTLKGAFSVAEMHNWIKYCIPEVPEKLQCQSGEKNKLYFKNIIVDTILECEYCKGEASFKSENVTTISILKDVLTKEATKKRIKLEISTNLNDASVAYVLKLIEPKVLHLTKSKDDGKWLMAVMDLDLRNEDEFNCLCTEYKDLLKHKNDIIDGKKLVDEQLERLYGFITDYFIDRFRLKGRNIDVKSVMISNLIQLLQNYNYMELHDFCMNAGNRDDGNDGDRNDDHIN